MSGSTSKKRSHHDTIAATPHLSDNDDEHHRTDTTNRSHNTDSFSDDDDEAHTMQVCAGCDRAICLACHELEKGNNGEPALLPCSCCHTTYQSQQQQDSDNEGVIVPLVDEFCMDCRNTCKFCGKLCCPNCSQQCGRCGLVVCPDDSKFVIECSNCHLPFCLICLNVDGSSNSGCPQCHAKPSKRMSQLAHLRLKSIGRAFQHSESSDDFGLRSMYRAFRQSDRSSDFDEFDAIVAHGTATIPHSSSAASNKMASYPIIRDADGESLVVKQSAQGTFFVEETIMDRDGGGELRTTTRTFEEWRTRQNDTPLGVDASTTSISNTRIAISQSEYKRQQEEADAAAAELLAQLDEEEIKEEKKKNKKKTKRKKKDSGTSSTIGESARVAVQGKEDKEVEENDANNPKNSETSKSKMAMKQRKKKVANPQQDNDDSRDRELGSTRDESTSLIADNDEDHDTGSKTPPEMTEDLQILSHTAGGSKSNQKEEDLLCQLVEDEDEPGLEKFLLDLKGVPGKGALRKNAKKALKRLAAAAAVTEEVEEEEYNDVDEEFLVDEQDGSPLIQVMSRKMNHHPSSTTGHVSQKITRMTSTGPRAECVLNMSPQLVGWVIGKGGVRIRDLMEDTGTRIWIDQESMGQHEPRVVYISAPKLSMVDCAVKSIQELVETAPGNASVSSTNHGGKRTTEKKEATGIKQAEQDTKRHAPEPKAPLRAGGAKQANVVREVLTCEGRYVPLLIGRRGWTIKHIQDTTGARVDIDQSVTPRRITVSGSENGVRKATRMVRDVLKYPHAQNPRDGEEAVGTTAGKSMDFAAAAKHQTHAGGSPTSIDPEIVRANFDVTGGHTPPPASLIMTGDARSTVSATSSLSSTPEPSSTKAQLKHGPIMTDYQREQYLASLGGRPIPPPGMVPVHTSLTPGRDRSGSSGQIGMGHSLLPELPGEQRPIGALGGLPLNRASSGSDRNLYGQTHPMDAMKRSVSTGHQARADLQDHWRGMGMMQPHLQPTHPTEEAFLSMQRTPSLPEPKMSHLPATHASTQQRHMEYQRQFSAPEPVDHMPLGRSGPAHGMRDVYRTAPGLGDSASGPGLWGRTHARTPQTEPPLQDSIGLGPSATYMSHPPQSRPVPSLSQPPNSQQLREENQLGSGYPHSSSEPVGSGPSGLHLGYPAHVVPMAGGEADSNLVDSMFGTFGVGGDQNILTGLAGLSLSNSSSNNNSTLGSRAAGWGQSIPGWGEGRGQADPPVPQHNTESLLSSESGLPPFLAGQYSRERPPGYPGQHQQPQQQQQQQQQQQSRFNWS